MYSNFLERLFTPPRQCFLIFFTIMGQSKDNTVKQVFFKDSKDFFKHPYNSMKDRAFGRVGLSTFAHNQHYW